MKRLVAALLLLSLASTARADIVGPPGDPARNEKITGIVTADTGAALLVGGIIMLAVGATRDDNDVKLKADLYLAGGLFTAVGAAGVAVGAVIWLLARKQTTEWQAGKVKAGLTGNGVKLTF